MTPTNPAPATTTNLDAFDRWCIANDEPLSTDEGEYRPTPESARWFFTISDTMGRNERADCSAPTLTEAENRIRRTWLGAHPHGAGLVRLVLTHVCEHNELHETPEACSR